MLDPRQSLALARRVGPLKASRDAVADALKER
jgi:hypothetical protein